MKTINDIADEWIAEGISITRCVLLGDEALAKHMVRNVFDAQEFKAAMAIVARLEVLRLDDKMKRFCCEKGEALGLSGMCCPDCAAINDGYVDAMTPNVKVTGAEPVLSAERPVDRRVGPPRRLRVCLACNDEHGIFAGRAWMAQPESLYRVGRHPWDAELVHDDWGRGVALTVDDKLMKLRIHRVWFPFKAHKTWHGNWCWDSFEFERSTGKRLLALMRDNGGWHCEAGPSKFYRWWNRRPNAKSEPTARLFAQVGSTDGLCPGD